MNDFASLAGVCWDFVGVDFVALAVFCLLFYDGPFWCVWGGGKGRKGRDEGGREREGKGREGLKGRIFFGDKGLD